MSENGVHRVHCNVNRDDDLYSTGVHPIFRQRSKKRGQKQILLLGLCLPAKVIMKIWLRMMMMVMVMMMMMI